MHKWKYVIVEVIHGAKLCAPVQNQVTQKTNVIHWKFSKWLPDWEIGVVHTSLCAEGIWVFSLSFASSLSCLNWRMIETITLNFVTLSAFHFLAIIYEGVSRVLATLLSQVQEITKVFFLHFKYGQLFLSK